jgi:hypothetical protein
VEDISIPRKYLRIPRSDIRNPQKNRREKVGSSVRGSAERRASASLTPKAEVTRSRAPRQLEQREGRHRQRKAVRKREKSEGWPHAQEKLGPASRALRVGGKKFAVLLA